MKMRLLQTERNLKLFLKDKANIFFSLLSPLIVLLLYVFFLGRVQTDGMIASLETLGISGGEDHVRAFADSWMLSGVLTCGCITVPLCACGQMVEDKKRGISADMLASPVPRWLPFAAYFCSVLAAGLVICLIVYAVCLVWLALAGSWCLSVADCFAILGTLLLSVFSSSTLLILIVRFFRSEGAFTGLNVILGTVIGFLVGAYMPLSMFPEAVQTITLFIPGGYSAGMFRNFFLRGSLDVISQELSPQFAEALADEYSLTLRGFGGEVTLPVMAVVLAGCTVLFAAVNVLISLKMSGKRRA